MSREPVLRIRIVFDQGRMIGPGKAELLERIDSYGSIAAAGREMGMSYKRAWTLIETLNAMFQEPLVARVRGGPGGGGAALTDAGHRVLGLYRDLERDAAQAGTESLTALCGLLADITDRK